MSSVRVLEAAQDRPCGPGLRLAHAAGILAGRLADLLEEVLPGEGPHVQGRDFLRILAAEATDPSGSEPLPGDPLPRLAEALGLAAVEVDLVLLAGLPELHEGVSSVLRTLHPRGEPRPSVGLAAQLFCRSLEERILLRDRLECGAAAQSGLLRLGDEAPFFERTLLLMDSAWPALQAMDVWPEMLERIGGSPSLNGLTGWLRLPEVRQVRELLGSGVPHTVLVTADSEEVALQRATALAFSAGVEFVRLVLPAAPAAAIERMISVHALARGAVPILRLAASEGPQAAEVPSFTRHPYPVVVCARTGRVRVHGERPILELPVERLSPGARCTMWSEVMPELAMHSPRLAARYTIEPDEAEATAGDVRGLAAAERRAPSVDDVARSVRTRSSFSLTTGIRLLRPTAGWPQLVLPIERTAVLREAIDRLQHQAQVLDGWGFLAGRPGARGVRLLFSGPSGTGKTLAAEVMAHEIGVDLLLVDISRVVSKWIGETEKNLAEVFDVAERAQAVLFFDEADALFGKRTEVSDAHDRYANLETAYLLSRLERFEGLAILATNLRQNIDAAFSRRLEFTLEFPEPALAERVALWRCHIPPGVPLAEEVDLQELAALYPVVGAVIRNAAVAAGFFAAAEGTPVTRRQLVRALRREYDKFGRAFPGFPAGLSAA